MLTALNRLRPQVAVSVCAAYREHEESFHARAVRFETVSILGDATYLDVRLTVQHCGQLYSSSFAVSATLLSGTNIDSLSKRCVYDLAVELGVETDTE